MLHTWALVFDVVDKNDRDVVITGLTGEQRAPNIINAAEKMRRAVENDPDLNTIGRPVSAFVTSCTQTVPAAGAEPEPDADTDTVEQPGGIV